MFLYMCYITIYELYQEIYMNYSLLYDCFIIFYDLHNLIPPFLCIFTTFYPAAEKAGRRRRPAVSCPQGDVAFLFFDPSNTLSVRTFIYHLHLSVQIPQSILPHNEK